MYEISGKRIVVTGCAGTVGREVVHQLVRGGYAPAEVLGVDNNESELFFLEQEYLEFPRVFFSLGDVRDPHKLLRLFQGIDVVVHCAALKHVVMCERSPFDAVQTNIHGVQNVIMAALENRVERVLYTSSDKAVNPTNVMGTSKLMGERLITAANSRVRSGSTVFSSTRFGNVLGSRGSVVPIFSEQIRRGGPVTLTDECMTRFIMTIEESARLVLDSINLMCGGEVFITKMPSVRIIDLARTMIAEFAPLSGHDPSHIELRVIGAKPGEKLYEELMSEEEVRRAVELERYYSITPAFRGLYQNLTYEYPGLISREVAAAYRSEEGPFLDEVEIRHFLEVNSLLKSEYRPGVRQ